MEQAVVFFDIDGTLLSGRTGEVPDSAKIAIDKLLENGHIPVINTGRIYYQVPEQILALPIRDYVCSCGLYILKNGEVIQDASPSRELMLKMRELVLECGFDVIFEAKEALYYIDGRVVNFGFRRDVFEAKGQGLYRGDEIMREDFHFDKFCVWYDNEQNYSRFAKEAEKYFSLIRRSSNFTELVPLGYSKGLGMKTYLSAIGGGARKMYAFGDSANDMEMFRAADVRVLMGNGDMSLKDETDYITDDVDADGVYNALRHFGLI